MACHRTSYFAPSISTTASPSVPIARPTRCSKSATDENGSRSRSASAFSRTARSTPAASHSASPAALRSNFQGERLADGSQLQQNLLLPDRQEWAELPSQDEVAQGGLDDGSRVVSSATNCDLVAAVSSAKALW